jgi:hypothetical protein
MRPAREGTPWRALCLAQPWRHKQAPTCRASAALAALQPQRALTGRLCRHSADKGLDFSPH